MKHSTLCLLLTLAGLCLVGDRVVRAADGPMATTHVGISGKLDALVLPGGELEAKPLTDRKTPVIVRVVRVYPHGSQFRYDLEYFGLEPGDHDLRQYLRRKDGSALGELPPIPVTVTPLLPKGQIEPNKVELQGAPRLGGYRILLITLGVLWGLGLIAIVASFVYPRRRKQAVDASQPVTVADKLRPLVEGALAGTLSQSDLANLERALLAHWRQRLGLEQAEPGLALSTIRQHPEGGPLLNQLESWLHRPGQPEPVDVPALLAPYRNLPAIALDITNGGTPA